MLTDLKNKSLREAAISWFLRLQKMDAAHPERSAFEAWLMASHSHQQAYADVVDMWDQLDSTPQLKQLTTALQKKNQQQHAGKIRAAFTALSIVMLSTFSFYSYQAWQAQPTMQMVATASIGELKTQALDDGSTVTMNAKSNVEITYYRNQRVVKLNSGEAIFEVSKDANRPFIVDSGDAKVTVLGTRFVVNKLKNMVRISVDHGRVQIVSNSIAGNPILLTDGQVAEVELNQSPKRVSRPASDAFTFQQSIITFNEATLDEITETLSRYRQQPVNVQPNLNSNARITAVVKARNIDKFLGNLPDLAPVRVVYQPDQALIVGQPN